MKILKKLLLLLVLLIATFLVLIIMGVELSAMLSTLEGTFNHAIVVLTSWDNLSTKYLIARILGISLGGILVLLAVIGFVMACVKYTKKNDANPMDFVNSMVVLGIIFLLADLARPKIASNKLFFGIVLGAVGVLGIYILYLFIHVCRIKKVKEEALPTTSEASAVEPAPAVEEKVEPAPVQVEEKAQEEPVSEPVVETPVEEIPEPVVEQVPETNELPSEEVEEERTYSTRLRDSEQSLREAYSLLKNQLMKHRKVHSRITKSCETFRVGYDQLAKIVVAGKGLKLYLAKDPLSVDSAIYHQRDASSKNNFVEVPFVVKVKSNLSIRKALQLIDMTCEEKGVEFKSRYEEVDYSKVVE